MKRAIYTIVTVVSLLMLTTSASAQLRTAYFMRGSTQRYELNPALSPLRGYLSIPVVGGLYASMESNFLSAENFFFPNGQNNGVVTYMHKSISAEEFLSRLPDVNHLELGLNDQILAIGNYFKGGFWSFGLRLRSENNVDIPKDFFALTKTLSTGTYDIAGLNIQSSNFIEASLGYTFPVQDVFTLGFRAKMLLGLAQVSANISTLNVEIGEESYHANMAGSFEANISGYNLESITGEVTMDKFISHLTDFNNFDPSNIKSIGFAVDAGIEWTFRDEQIRLSAAVNDLGYNSWNAHNSFCAAIDNVNFSFEGFDLENNEVKFDAPDNIVLRKTNEIAEGRRALHASVVVGLEYNFANDLVGVGALWNTKKYSNRAWHSIGGAITFRPTTWFSASASYSLVNKLGVAGLALNVHSSMCNIFIGTDYISTKYGTAGGGSIPIPLDQQSFNLSFGVSIPLSPRMF